MSARHNVHDIFLSFNRFEVKLLNFFFRPRKSERKKPVGLLDGSGSHFFEATKKLKTKKDRSVQVVTETWAL
jgi:hypothetical protein